MARPDSAPAPRGRTPGTPAWRSRWLLPTVAGILLILLSLGSWSLARSRQGSLLPAGHAMGEDAFTGVEMPHLHGLGFSADGRQLLVPAHNGLRVFADGAWQTPAVPAHDYMGFAVTDDGFYSSGHPAPGTTLVNPLGLVKSTDGGATLQQLGFAGESDFHGMAVGYYSHAVYVLNPSPNTRLGTGLYYSLDDGATWRQSAAQGVSAAPMQLAVHPTDPQLVALATANGVLLSRDHGDSFAPIVTGQSVTAVAFSLDGTRLLLGSTSVSTYDLASTQLATLPAPALEGQDVISYIAMHPVRPDELALATLERHIYRSVDGGTTWMQLARAGVGIATP